MASTYGSAHLVGLVANVTFNLLFLAKFPCPKSFDSIPGLLMIGTPGGGSALSDYARGVGRFSGHDLYPRQKPGEASRKEKSLWER